MDDTSCQSVCVFVLLARRDGLPDYRPSVRPSVCLSVCLLVRLCVYAGRWSHLRARRPTLHCTLVSAADDCPCTYVLAAWLIVDQIDATAEADRVVTSPGLGLCHADGSSACDL